MSNDKTKLLLILSLILVSLLSNKSSTPFYEFEGNGNINHDTALALKSHDPSQNNTDILSIRSPINRTNNSSSDVSALVDKATAPYFQGNYTQAIQYYDKALSLDPNDKHALYNQGNNKLAIQYYDKALAPDPHYIDAIFDRDTALNGTASASAFIDRANALYVQGNYTEAIPYFDRALEIDPNNKDALNGKGAALNSLGNYTRAIQYYDMALAIDPNNKYALDGKGNALYGLGNDTQAIQYFDKSLAVDPNFKQALYDKGFTLYGIDNYTQAIQYYNKALSIDSNYTDALNGRQDAISQKVASAPISGFSRGCSDSQIYDTADRYINQTGMGPSFHSKQFMQAYNEGYRSCSSNSESQSKSSGNSGDRFAVQKPYWISHDIYRPNFTNIAVFMDEVDTGHNVTYAEICVPTIDPAKPDCHIEKDKPHSDILMVCLNSEVAKITHRVCHVIDTAKELQKSGQGHTGTVNAGVFVFPVTMIPDYKKIEGCIYVSDVSSCDTNLYDTGHGLVMHLDTHSAYNNYYDYYSGPSVSPYNPSTEMQANIDPTQLPTVPTYQPPQVYGEEVVPEGDTTYAPQPPYGTEIARGPIQKPVPSTGAFDPRGAPGTANVPIDTSGLTKIPKGAIPSPQQLATPVKSKSKPTLTKLQQQQDHLQNSQTSRGNIVKPPNVTVSQAHPAPANVSGKPSTSSLWYSPYGGGTPFNPPPPYGKEVSSPTLPSRFQQGSLAIPQSPVPSPQQPVKAQQQQQHLQNSQTSRGNVVKPPNGMTVPTVETSKMFNLIVLKGNITDETANTRICTTVSEGYPQKICQNLDNLKPENGSNSIESNIFTFNSVPVNASFHSCIQRLIYPNVTLCDNFGSRNYQGPTIEQLMLPFFGVNPVDAQDDEGYTICPQYLTEVQCYGKVVKTPNDGYDVNDTSIERANKSTTADHPTAGPLTDTPHKPRPVPPAAPGHANIQSRYGPGTEARSRIDYQMGCNCNGQYCCFRGHKCDGSIGAECTTLSSANASTAERNSACTALSARFNSLYIR